MSTPAEIRAAVKYNRERVDRIMVKPDKDIGAAIRAAAKASGQPLQRYVLDAVRERMEREGQPVTLEPSVDGPAPEA